MKTRTDILYTPAGQTFTAQIPAGTPVEPADNIPGKRYWALPWPDMTLAERRWMASYGYLLQPSEVIA